MPLERPRLKYEENTTKGFSRNKVGERGLNSCDAG
jgi:hypothetical protein